MDNHNRYEKYSLWIIFLSNLVSLSIYAIGIYIVAIFGTPFLVCYLLFCGWIEMNVMRWSCRSCYYYGKVCAFGKGKLCSFLFNRKDGKEFTERKIRWYNILPDFMVFLIPLCLGIFSLFRNFSWLIGLLLLLLLLLSFAGNAFIHGSLACKYCKQQDMGCPALELFNKKNV
ncbi:MAG: hypothetical protein C4527_08040 [Candidatus Omnitrophota bacterium]|nr:MAG: hypothetical protein C4527_08040 [Candidatus Omnitrophota bacterium]